MSRSQRSFLGAMALIVVAGTIFLGSFNDRYAMCTAESDGRQYVCTDGSPTILSFFSGALVLWGIGSAIVTSVRGGKGPIASPGTEARARQSRQLEKGPLDDPEPEIRAGQRAQRDAWASVKGKKFACPQCNTWVYRVEEIHPTVLIIRHCHRTWDVTRLRPFQA